MLCHVLPIKTIVLPWPWFPQDVTLKNSCLPMHAMKWTQERYPYYNFLQKSTSHWCKTWFRNVKRVSFIYYHDNMLLLVHQYIFPKEFPSVNSQPRSRSMVKVKNLQKENVFFIQLWAQWHTFPYTLHIIQSIHPLHGQWPAPGGQLVSISIRETAHPYTFRKGVKV